MHLEKELSFQQPQITFLVLGSPPPTHTHTLVCCLCSWALWLWGWPASAWWAWWMGDFSEDTEDGQWSTSELMLPSQAEHSQTIERIFDTVLPLLFHDS